MKPLVLIAVVVGAFVSSHVGWAQGTTDGLRTGDSVRVFLIAETSDAPCPFRGRVLTVGADSLILHERGVAWVDVARLERLGENRRRELGGVLLGVVVGAGVGWIVGELSGRWLAPPFYAAIGGLLVGPAVGAAVGARSDQPWVEVPLERRTVGLQVVARF